MYSIESKKIPVLFVVLLLVTYVTLKIPSTRAQQAPPEGDEQIPSDLSLDLDLAQKEPAPAQKQIVQSQTPQAQITTSSGDSIVVTVKDVVPPEVKTQSVRETVSPEQTTSEQVVEKKETNPSETNGPNNNIDNGATQDGKNIIPGTNITEPDDNAAPPLPTPSTPAGGSPSGEQPNTIPLENGVAPAPAPEAPAPAPDVGSSPKDSTAPAPVVQGVSVGPTVSWLRQFINKLLR